MQINFTREQIKEYADRYVYDADDVLGARMEAAARRGHMTRDDLIEVARWKWRGGATRKLCSQNSEAEVEEITGISFAAKTERLRIGALLALHGVQWPMASVILHFAFPDRFPILDVRAMNAVGGSTHYTFEKWVEYTELCQKTAAKHKVCICQKPAGKHEVCMRTLDKALWAYDKGTP